MQSGRHEHSQADFKFQAGGPRPARLFHHSTLNNGRKISNISNSTRQTHRQKNAPAFFDYCPLRHSSRQLRRTKVALHSFSLHATPFLHQAGFDVNYKFRAPADVSCPPALPGALLPPPALHPSPVAALAPFIFKLLARFCVRA